MSLNVGACQLPKFIVQTISDNQNYPSGDGLAGSGFKQFLSFDEELVYLNLIGHSSLKVKLEGPHRAPQTVIWTPCCFEVWQNDMLGPETLVSGFWAGDEHHHFLRLSDSPLRRDPQYLRLAFVKLQLRGILFFFCFF